MNPFFFARLVRAFLLTSRRHLLQRNTVNRRYTLAQNETSGRWELREEQTNRLVRSWKTKTEATSKAALERCLGAEGGSVVIRKKGGVFEEERRYAGR
jgi:hypothetical protein